MDRLISKALYSESTFSKASSALWIGSILSATGLTCWLLVMPPSNAMPAIRTVLLGLGIFVLPGYLVRWLIFANDKWPLLTEIPLWFGLSLGAGAVVWLAARALHGSLELFGYLVTGALLILATSAILLHRPKWQQASAFGNARTGRDLLPLVLLLATVLFWTVVVLRIGASYMPMTDNWYYLAVVRRILMAGNVVPGDPFFAGVADAERSGPWLAMVTLWVKQSGIDLVVLWELLPALVIPVSLLAFYRLAWILFRDRWVASLAVALVLAGWAGFTWNEPMMMAVPSNVALLLSFVTLGLAIEFGRTGRAAYLLTAVLLAGATAVQHFLVFGGMLLMLAVYGILQLGMSFLLSWSSENESDVVPVVEWRKAGIRLVLILVLSIIVSTPALVFWSQSTTNTTNPIWSDLWGLFKEIGPWHVLRVSSLSGGPHLFVFSFLLLPLLVLHVRQHDWAVFLLAMMALVVSIAFLPPVVELILQTGLLPPWGIWRLAAQVYPFQLTIAALLCWGVRAVWPHVLALFGGRRWPSLLVMAGLVLLGLIPNSTPLVALPSNYLRLAQGGHPMEDVVTWLRQGPLAVLPETKGPLVVLSDVSTSYFITGLTGHYVLAIPYGHASTVVSDDQERRDRVSCILTAEASLNEMRALLEQHDVTALVLVEGAGLGGDSLSPEAWEYWVDTLDAAGSEFESLFRGETGNRRAAVYSRQPGKWTP